MDEIRYHVLETKENKMAGHIADSSNINWCSPLWITDNSRIVMGGIDLDPCGNPASARRTWALHTKMLPRDNGIEDDWSEVEGRSITSVYVNSPFGRYFQSKTTRKITLPTEMRRAHAEVHALHGPEVAAKWKSDFMADNNSYSIADWVRKCSWVHAAHNIQAMQLGPANVGTTTWHDIIEETASAIFYPRGRLYFENVDFETGEVLQTGPAPMDCAMAYWGPNTKLFKKVFESVPAGEKNKLGHVHILR